MPIRQTVTGILISIILLAIIVEMVRRRKLGEEYSCLWILAGIGVFVLSIFHKLLFFISDLFGIEASAFTLFVIAFFFLVLINLHFSVKISAFSRQIKNLTQKLAILEAESKEDKTP